MGISIRIPGASFSSSLTSLTIPNREGLVQEYILGKNAEQSSLNRANPDAPATLFGAPIYAEHYVRVGDGTSGPNGGEGGFLTTVPDEGPSRTVIALSVREASAPNYLAIFGAYAEAGYLGLSQYPTDQVPEDGGASFFNNITGSGMPDVPVVTAAVSPKFRFTAGWGTQGEPGYVTMGVAGNLVTPVAGTTNGGGAGRFLQLGGYMRAIGGNGQMRVAYAAHFNRILSAQEREDIYESLKAFYAGKIEIE